MREYIKKYKDVLLKFIDFLVVFFMAILSIKKGGFYKSDYLEFNFFISLVGIFYMILKAKVVLKDKQIKKDEMLFLMFGLGISYSLPLIFKNYSNLSDTLFEFTKYYNMLIIYFIIKHSTSKNIYINGIIVISFIQCLLGIDQIANRFLEGVLNELNTGYLSTNLDRMSGTIQYANTFAILIVISIILLIKKIDNSILNKNEKMFSVLNMIVTVHCICLILTKTRFALLILIALVIVLIISKSIISKKKILSVFIINIIAMMISSSIITKCINLNLKFYIYLYMLIFVIIYIILSYFYMKFICKFSVKMSKKTKIILVCIIMFSIILYFIFAFNIPATVKLNEKNTTYSADIYLNVKSENSVRIKILSDDKNSQYKLKFSYLDKQNGEIVLCEEENNINTNNMISIDNINVDTKNFKCFRIYIERVTGEISVKNVVINNKNYAISYILIPYQIVERIFDGLTGSDSISIRFTYYSDAIKIIKDSLKNFLIGCGGEAFKNMYNQFKEVNYVSSEVHNSYLQIFCESGLIGFLFILSIIVFVIKKYKLDEIKIALYALIIHSILDLNFSYMISVAFFALLIGCLSEKKVNYIKNKHIIYFIFLCVVIVISIIITFIEFRANIAKEIYISDNEYEDLSINESQTYISTMLLYKNKFEYDKTDYKSLKGYIDIKLNYIKFLNYSSYDNKLIKIKEQMIEVEQLIKYMRKTNKYSKDALFYIFNVYYTYKSYFIYTFFDSNEELGNVYYQDVMTEILNTIEKYFPKQEAVIERVKNKRELIIY